MELELPPSLSERRRSLLLDAASRLDTTFGSGLHGFVLSGSAGRGCDNDHSDLDLLIILDPEIVNGPDAPWSHTPELEQLPITLDHLEAIADFTDGDWGYRWSYAWAPVLADRTGGRIARAIDRQTHLTTDETMGILVRHQGLDGWLNLAYRALKSARDGNTFEASLDASESIPMLLDVIFALNGLVRPYNKYLRWALDHHPLTDWPADELLALITGIRRGDRAALLDGVERVRRAAARFDEANHQETLIEVFKSWPSDRYPVLELPY
ncbi:MAG: hypothetical protein J2P23_08760 [Microlunatus sp.]|nr:hypothetical protein [Microlunatus sp.]